MKTPSYLLFILLCAALVVDCTPKKKKSVPYYDYSVSYEDGSSINIPFTVDQGVKWVSAKINGVSTDMIFDTGCSGVLISPLELAQLMKRGVLSESDCVDRVLSQIADGSVVEEDVYLLKTLELTDGTNTIVCTNVRTSVSSSLNGPVLLGNDVFDRVASFTVDNDSRLIKFVLK